LGPRCGRIGSVSWWAPGRRYKNGVGPFPGSEAYARTYPARYNVVPDYGEASSTVVGVALQAAAEKAGSIDPVALRDSLAALDIPTFYGPVKFGPSGQIQSQKCPVFQIQNQKR